MYIYIYIWQCPINLTFPVDVESNSNGSDIGTVFLIAPGARLGTQTLDTPWSYRRLNPEPDPNIFPPYVLTFCCGSFAKMAPKLP